MAELGSDGWELVSVTGYSDDCHTWLPTTLNDQPVHDGRRTCVTLLAGLNVYPVRSCAFWAHADLVITDICALTSSKTIRCTLETRRHAVWATDYCCTLLMQLVKNWPVSSLISAMTKW